jgi:hypothetical protein
MEDGNSASADFVPQAPDDADDSGWLVDNSGGESEADELAALASSGGPPGEDLGLVDLVWASAVLKHRDRVMWEVAAPLLLEQMGGMGMEELSRWACMHVCISSWVGG